MLEARILHRVATLPLAAVLALAVVVTKIQEPAFFRSLSRPFFWPSVGALLFLAVCVLPLIWTATGHRGREQWARRLNLRPLHSVCAAWLGILLVGSALATGTVLLSITLESIEGPISWGAAIGTLVRSVLVLSPLSALAPALAHLGWQLANKVVAWGLLLAASIGVFGPGLPIPLDRFFAMADIGTGALGTMLLGIETTAAGLLISLAVVSRGTR